MIVGLEIFLCAARRGCNLSIMKTTLRIVLLIVLLGLASFAHAAIPPLSVTVADASGKMAFKGMTNANGTFATPKLKPGNYVVQLNGKGAANGQYALVISAGKKKVTADAVNGGKFGAGGVAMRIEVGEGLNITGQVANAPAAAASNPNVKIMNGKRYVFIMPETGSNLGGRWVLEDSPEAKAARKSGRMSQDYMRKMQDKGDTHQEGFPIGR